MAKNLNHFEPPKDTKLFVQAALPYDEPPSWYLPVANRLGEALAEAGDVDRSDCGEIRRFFWKRGTHGYDNSWMVYGGESC